VTLVNAYRRVGADHAAAASVAGVDRRTAKKAWDEGLRESFAQKPIRQIIEEEKQLTRARLDNGSPPTTEEVGLARSDAVKQRAAEANMVRASRGNVLNLLLATTKMVKGGTLLAAKLELRLEEMGASGDINDALKALRDIAGMTTATANAANLVIRMERRLLGEGEEAGVDTDEMTPDEAIRELEYSAKALTRARVKWGDASVPPTETTPPAPAPAAPENGKETPK